MKFNHYSVSPACIGCRACVKVAPANFAMDGKRRALVTKQPENEAEEAAGKQAQEVCPVAAIASMEQQTASDSIEPILASSNILRTMELHPQLREVLIALSPRFERMRNPAMFNVLAKFASFRDAARVSGVSLCEILHALNAALGVQDKLLAIMPECIADHGDTALPAGTDVDWTESPERYVYSPDTLEDMIRRISALGPQQSLVILSVDRPDELVKTAAGLGRRFNLEKNREYRLSLFNPAAAPEARPWQERTDAFENLDVRAMRSDPFDVIIKKAYQTPEDGGFVLIQTFEPTPLINMLTEMGFEYRTEQRKDNEFRVYFYKTPTQKGAAGVASTKVPVVIQSATPVAYPIIMRLLQSEVLRRSVEITELKVWEETEKHLAWIQSGRADISFSALITAAKMRGSDIKIPALLVWDNFSLLTRHPAQGFGDLRGREIALPLFEEAPPAKITKYLIEAAGFNAADFRFVFGSPFGRPEKMYTDFVEGKLDTVVLREPEVSYALKIMADQGEAVSIISFNELWNQAHPGFGSYPNAGVVLKGEFVRRNPELTKIFLQELKSAVEWVTAHRPEAAKLSFDIMRQDPPGVELFLDRVHFEYVDGHRLADGVQRYFEILNAQGIVNLPIDADFMQIFNIA